jgi:hypothetical protein
MRTLGGAVLAVAAIAIPSAWAETIRIPAGTVLKVTFEQSLGLERNREGDRFRAKVKDDRELEGAILEGRVVRVVPNQGARKGFLELEFNRLTLPEGPSARVQALPIRWSEKDLRRQPDGRFVSKAPISRDKYVAGGMIGGLLLGSILKKPFEGAFLGSLAGILLAEADDNKTGELVVRRGETYGAYFERGVEIRLEDPRDRWSRDDRRDRSEDVRREDDQGIGGGRWSVSLDGKELTYEPDLEPYDANGVAMVPLDATARQLGLAVERLRRDNGQDFFLIEGDKGLLRLNLGLDSYRFNGEQRRMPRNPEVRRGVIYVPIEVLEALAEGKLEARFVD